MINHKIRNENAYPEKFQLPFDVRVFALTLRISTPIKSHDDDVKKREKTQALF